MIRTTGACLGLLGFSVTIIAGLSVDNPATTTLSRALWALAAFYLLGSLLGYVAHRVIDEHALHLHHEMFGDAAEHPVSRSEASEAAEGDGSGNPANAAGR